MSVEVLPSYTPEVLPRYDLAPTTSSGTRPSTPLSHSSLLAHARDRSRYHYVSDRMDLDLGVRRWGTWLPAYGRDGLVEGTVTVRSFKHVDRIVVRLIGKAVTSHVINQIPTFSQTHTLLHKSTLLWSSNSPSGSGQPVPAEFPFSFALSGDGKPLPPSSSTQLRKASAYIAYAVRVDMYRRGVYMHQSVQTEILYLPRTASRYSRPFVPLADPTNEKRRQLDPAQWHRTSSSPSLLLPRELRYPAGQAIPFIISGSDALSKTIPEVELVRTTNIKTRAGTIRERQIISRGRQLETGSGHTITGVIDTGESGKETSWEAAGIGSVSYAIRFGDIVEAVELVSHEWRGENTSGFPALELDAAGRRALHFIDMGI